MTTINHNPFEHLCKDEQARETAVTKAFTNIKAQIKEMLPEYRYSFMMEYLEIDNPSIGIYEFVSPVINISYRETFQEISYSKNRHVRTRIGLHAFSELTRIIYRETAKENTAVNIEDCLNEQKYNHKVFEKAVEKHNTNNEG